MKTTLDALALIVSVAASPSLRADEPNPTADPHPQRAPMLDIHIHLFGSGDSGSGCKLSPEITDSFVFRHLRRTLNLSEQGQTLDEAYLDMLIRQLRGSGLDRGVLLAQDAVYDAAGQRDEARTHVYVPNDYLFRVVARHPDLFIACPSINPDRADCLDELARCKRQGARIIKIHPPIQGVDVSDPKHTEFFRRCAEWGVIVMVHTGHEHSAPVIDIHLADPRKLELALEQGCTVVACHCGSGWPGEEPDLLTPFLEMAGRYERLYGDTAILGSAFRAHDVGRLLAHPEILPRLLHGSDYPFPSAPWAFWHRLGPIEAGRIAGEQNLLKRDLMLKVALGFDPAGSVPIINYLTAPRPAVLRAND